jgi:small subunit ribosomal protein S1
MSEELSAGGSSFAELFEQASKEATLEGKVVKGVVVGVDDKFITIDVGLKSEGRIAAGEFLRCGRKMELKVGDKIDVFVERYENKNGEISLSREKALREAAWDDFETAFKDGVSVTGIITNRVKGGFIVELEGASAFLPGSQVDVRPVKDISPFLGIEQPFLIIKMDKVRENIVVSRRGILEGANAEERAKIVANLEEGQVIDGIVKNIASYGAFVDIGGVDGLLHNTDIAWKRINHPSEVLTPGQKIQVKIIKFNRDSKRISLGMKQLSSDPWNGADEEFKVGTRVKGKVSNVTGYGIFVELKEGVEGLVYVSEVSWKKNASPSEVASAGEEVEVIVLDVDVSKRRIGLGIRQLQANPWDSIEKDFPIGHIFEGTITSIADFGLFVKVSGGIEGMVHVNDLSWEKLKEGDLAKYKKGDAVKVKVLEIDREKERIALGVKQLTENPRSGIEVEIKKGAVVTCVVSAIKEEGIEATLADGTEGFIKKTDLAKDRQDRRTDRFAVGEKFDAKIISVEKGSKRKIGLSIRVLEIEEEKRAMEEFGSSDSGASLGDILGIAISKNEKN